MVDTFAINYLFGRLSGGGNADPAIGWVTSKAVGEYLIKLVIAIGLTPAVYARTSCWSGEWYSSAPHAAPRLSRCGH